MNRGIIFIFIFLVFILECGFTYQVNVTSTSAPNTEDKKKYYLATGLEEIRPENLQAKKYEDYVDRALILGGFARTYNLKDAELVIFTVSGGQGAGEDENIVDFTGFECPEHLPKTIPKFSYLRVLQLKGCVFGKKGLIDIWITTAYSFTPKGEGDLLSRRYLPFLAAAMIPYIGSNTGKAIEIKLNENNKAVMEIKGLTNVN